MKNSSSPSILMAMARIAVGVMFLFFAEYKLASTWFAREGYAHWVTGFAQNTAVGFYRPFLNFTLRHHWIFGYATAVLETLIGLSMVSGYLVRQFSLLGALFMANFVLCSWVLPAGTAPWRYLGNQLDNIPLLLLFLVFYAEDAGVTLGLDGRH